MGAGGLHNYMCRGDTAEWQWSVAPMGIGEGARVSVAMRLGGLGNSMAAMFKLELELQPGQKINGYRMAPNGCAAMGDGCLLNSVAVVTLPNCNGQWAQWV